MIDHLEREVDELEREMRRLGAEHRYVALLTAVLGIAWVLGYAIASELGDVERFATRPSARGFPAMVHELLAPRYVWRYDVDSTPSDRSAASSRSAAPILGAGRLVRSSPRAAVSYGSVRFSCGGPRYGNSGSRSSCGPTPSSVTFPFVKMATLESPTSSVSRRPFSP
jgi:hypothetical protein